MHHRRPQFGRASGTVVPFRRQEQRRRPPAYRNIVWAAQVFVIICLMAVVLVRLAPSVTELPVAAFWQGEQKRLAATGEPSWVGGYGACYTALQGNCVIDGDTIRHGGDKIRIADIDTPETFEPRCREEYERGMRAKTRLVELLNTAPFRIVPAGGRDRDQYDRQLRLLVREDGRSIGGILVSEGLARRWTGRRESWCG